MLFVSLCKIIFFFFQTASSKTHKTVSTAQRSVAHVPLVSAPGNGTIRLPIQQSQQGLTTHLAHGSKMVNCCVLNL